MTVELLFYTQVASIIGFVAALFVLYRLLVKQKDATIEVLKEKNAYLAERFSDAAKVSPDALADSLSKRVHLLTEEIECLRQDKNVNQNTVREKENVNHVLHEALAAFQATSNAQTAMVREDFDSAILHSDTALNIAPEIELPYVIKGMALKRKGKVKEAIETLSTLISKNDRSAVAYYNVACYKSLAGYSKEEVLNDLKKAISLNPSYKQIAAYDADLSNLADHPDFLDFLRS